MACLLDYLVSSAPNPLVAGENGTIYISIVPATPSATPDVYCGTIVFFVPCGSDVAPAPCASGACLFASQPAANVITGGADWDAPTLVAVDAAMAANYGLRDDLPYVSLMFKNRNPGTAIAGPICFSLTGMTTATVGGAACIVHEQSAISSNPLSWQTGQWAVAKVPPQLYLRNVYACAMNASAPLTEVGAGMTFALNWETNGTSLTLYGYGDPIPISPTTGSTYTFGAGIDVNSTFVLMAQDSATPPNQRYAVVSIAVTNPVLTAQSLSVTGSVTLPWQIAMTDGTVVSLPEGTLRLTCIPTTPATPSLYYLEFGDLNNKSENPPGPEVILCNYQVEALPLIKLWATTVQAGDTLQVNNAIQIGSWTIQPDATGNLAFTSSQSGVVVTFPQPQSL
jgi:hypothetical protein